MRCECVMGYSGEMCEGVRGEGCPVGFYGAPECRPCYCHQGGVMEDVCDGSGRCLCNVRSHNVHSLLICIYIICFRSVSHSVCCCICV